MARRLVAILAADVVGYSRMMAADEAGTHARMRALLTDFIEPRIDEHHGRTVRLAGDGALVEFASVVDAVECAAAIQSGVAKRQIGMPEDRRIKLRIGINIGDVIIEEGDICGDGVNVAARLERLAEPGEIWVSRTVHDHAKAKVAFGFEPMGEHQVKNIPEPVMVYRVITDPGATPQTTFKTRGLAQHARLAKCRLAVLPFINISADPEDEYFSDGMTEELISKLSRLNDLTVIARTSVMQYKGTAKSIAQIGYELKVETILEGSVRKSGNRLRITTQLIDVSTQGHIWSHDYDRIFDDVFSIQSDVAHSVVDALRVTIETGEKHQIQEHGTRNLQAYNLYLHGLHFFHRQSEEGLKHSIYYFEKALQYDRSFGQAFAGIAIAYEQLGDNSLLVPRDAYERARAAAERALELDETIVEAHLVAAAMAQYCDCDHVRARFAYERAIELAPNSAAARDWYGIMYLSPMGRHEEAIAQNYRAVELDPFSVLYLSDLGWVYYMARQYDAAIEFLQRSLELEPNSIDGHRGLGEIYVQKGMYNEAILAMQKYVDLTKDRTDYALGYLGYAYGMAGRRDSALEILKVLQDRARRQHVMPYAYAPLYVGLGDSDEAIKALQKEYEERSHTPFLLWLKVCPMFDTLHSDRRFIDLLRRIGVEQG